jgi:hypothetical protein
MEHMPRSKTSGKNAECLVLNMGVYLTVTGRLRKTEYDRLQNRC